MAKAARVVCVFLVPILRDSDRKPHAPTLWRLLQDALLTECGGLTGPEEVVVYRQRSDVRGAWDPGDAGPVEDLSRRYTVALPARRVNRFRALLRRVGNSFDQRAIHFEVAGFAELLPIREEHGWLEIG